MIQSLSSKIESKAQQLGLKTLQLKESKKWNKCCQIIAVAIVGVLAGRQIYGLLVFDTMGEGAGQSEGKISRQFDAPKPVSNKNTHARTPATKKEAEGNAKEIDGDEEVPASADKLELQSDSNLAIFYNVYLPLDEDNIRRKEIMDNIFTSQIGILGESYSVQSEKNKTKTVKLFYNTIGFPLDHTWLKQTCAPFSNLQPVHLKHYETGMEDVTLDALQEYCKENPTHHAIYVHPKGSFHPSKKQNNWRNEGTRAAASEDCDKRMHEGKCNACGARYEWMTPHFAGNLWRADCAYIQELRPASEIASHFQKAYETAIAPPMNMTFVVALGNQGNLGLNRFGAELWLGSHPHFWPCPTGKFGIGRPGWSKLKSNTAANAAARRTEFFLLPGLLWKFATIYNDTTFPPEDSWIWENYPDGLEYRDAVQSLGSLKGAVQQMMANRTSNR